MKYSGEALQMSHAEEVRRFHEKIAQERNYVRQREATAGYKGDAPAHVGYQTLAPTEQAIMDAARRWAANGDQFWGAAETYDALPPGVYKCGATPQVGPILVKQRVETDNLLELPDDATTAILAEFEQFWKIGDKFRQHGFLHKRGFLMWGPPGSGKTSTIQLLIKRLIEECGGVVLLLEEPQIAALCLSMLRKIESKRPIVAVMEDIDALVQKYGESEYLALLDGEAQVDNIVFAATTNYPERLDRRFVDRPSRFDTIRYVGMPSAAARRAYFTAKADVDGDELETWVKVSDGFSIAHLKELIIAVRCFEQPLHDVVERLEAMRVKRPDSGDTPESFESGFISFRNGGALQ